MPIQEKYSLTWPSYSDQMKVMMKELMTCGDFADITLVCDDKQQIRAHKNILAACSPVFKDILQIENSSVIYLKGVYWPEMESILEFIYLGEAVICKERMNYFLDVAKTLEIKELNKGEFLEEKQAQDVVEEMDNSVMGNENGDDIGDEEHKGIFEPKQKSSTNFSVPHNNVDRKDLQFNHPIELNPYKCNDCEKTFRGGSGLSQHNKAVHEGVTFDCSYCDYRAKLRTNLKRHIGRHHKETFSTHI